MTVSLSAARSRAIFTLQALRGRRDPSSFEFKVYDRAIGLALSPARPETAYLARDCIRNASSIEVVARRRAEAFVQFGSPAAAEEDPADAVPNDLPDQFETLKWARSYASFQAAVSALHRHAPRVLLGLEQDEPVEAVAAATAMSARQIKTLRAAIRALAGTALVAGRA